MYLKETLIKRLNSLILYKSDYEVPKVKFLFGGYCWFRKAFKIWKFDFDVTKKRFYSQLLTAGVWRTGDLPVFFIGDYLTEAREELITRLKEKRNFTTKNYVDMEPLETINSMLKTAAVKRSHHLIGGPLQMLKVYRSLIRVPFGVAWTINGNAETTLFGMPIHTRRHFSYPIIDPETLMITNSRSFI
jgi:hypothetical protein